MPRHARWAGAAWLGVALAGGAASALVVALVGPVAALLLGLAAGAAAIAFALRWEVAALLAAASWFIGTGRATIGSGIYPELIWGSVAVIVAAGVARGWRGAPLTTASRNLVLLLGLFILCLALAIPLSPEPDASRTTVVQFGAFLAYLVGLVVITRDDGPVKLARVVECVAFLGGVIFIFRLAQAGQLRVIEAAQDLGGAKHQSFTLIGNVNSFGYVFMLGIPPLVTHIATEKRRSRKLVPIIGLAVVAAALLLTVSRAAMLGTVVGCLVSLVILLRLSPRLLALLAAAALAAIVVLVRHPDIVSPDGLAYGNAGYNGRELLWSLAVSIWHDSPWIGHGAETWDYLAGGVGTGPHNIALALLVSGGVVLLCIALAIAGSVITVGVKATRRLRAASPLAAGAAAGATGSFVACLARGAFESTGPFDARHWFTILSWAVIAIVLSSWEYARARGRDGAGEVEPEDAGAATIPHR